MSIRIADTPYYQAAPSPFLHILDSFSLLRLAIYSFGVVFFLLMRNFLISIVFNFQNNRLVAHDTFVAHRRSFIEQWLSDG